MSPGGLEMLPGGVEPTLAVWRYAQPVLPMLGVLAVAFAVSLVMTPVMRKVALASGIVDWPDAKRKAHAKPVAYLGGLAIFLGWLCGVLFFIAWLAPGVFEPIPGVAPHREGFPTTIILGAVAILLTGLFDDVYGISARVKIGGQFFAAAAIAMDEVGTTLTKQSLELMGLADALPPWAPYWLGTFAIAGLILGGCNAMNLVDGLDGLASGIAGITALGLLVIAAIFVMDVPLADAWPRGVVPIVMALAILGAVLGFLPYNFNPASIFMGDTGSLLLGYLIIATILIFGDGMGWSPMLFSAGLICFALPITDTALSILRRKLQGKPIFAPDAMHIHHMLRRSGLGVKQSVLVMYAIAACFSAIGVALVAVQLQWRLTLMVFVALVGVILLVGYRTSRSLEAHQRTAIRPVEARAPGEEHAASANTQAKAQPADKPAKPATTSG